MQMRSGNVSQAFAFTSLPPWKHGTHKSVTDWTHRMDWHKSKVIGGAPSGKALDAPGFQSMIEREYPALLQTSGYRFVGDDSSWQIKRGARARQLLPASLPLAPLSVRPAC